MSAINAQLQTELLGIVESGVGLTAKEIHRESDQSPDQYTTQLALNGLVRAGKIRCEAYRFYPLKFEGRQKRNRSSTQIEQSAAFHAHRDEYPLSIDKQPPPPGRTESRDMPEASSPPASPPSEDEVMKDSTLLLKHLPGTSTQLAERTGLKLQVVCATLKQLKDDGEVSSKGWGRGVVYSKANGAAPPAPAAAKPRQVPTKSRAAAVKPERDGAKAGNGADNSEYAWYCWDRGGRIRSSSSWLTVL